MLNVSRQGYWAWKHRPLNRRRGEDERLKPLIRQAWRAFDETYGAPRLHAELRLGGGVRVGKKRVARLMRELEIKGVSRRRGRVRTTTFGYIETFYNPLRRHSSLSMLSPDQYEHQHEKEAATAVAA